MTFFISFLYIFSSSANTIIERQVENLSPKELLYVDDALSHEQLLKMKCDTCASQLQDVELKNFVSQMSATHQQNFGQFYQLLRG